MKLRYIILPVTIMIFGVLLPISASYAAPATATIALNVRSGPGINYSVVDTLEAGQQVNSTKCEAGWCYIVKPGPDGWVSQNYLRMGGPQRPDPILQNLPFQLKQLPLKQPRQTQLQLPWPFQPAQPDQPAQPAAKPFILPETPAPAPQFPWPIQPRQDQLPFNLPGGGTSDVAPIPSPYQVCFFDGENFTAQSKCVTSGRSFSRLGPEWNDRISSLTIKPGARVTLCQRQNFQEPCGSFNSNVAVLPPQLNNKVTSGRVF